MSQGGKVILSEKRNKYILFMDEIFPPDYPVRVSGSGFELIEANGSIKIIDRERLSADKVSEINNNRSGNIFPKAAKK